MLNVAAWRQESHSKPQTQKPLTADEYLKQQIVRAFGNDGETADVNKFKGFLDNIQEWILSHSGHSLEQKKAAIGGSAENLLGKVKSYVGSNPAFVQLQNQLNDVATNTLIDTQLKVITESLEAIDGHYENLKGLKLSDKAIQLALSETDLKNSTAALDQLADTLNANQKSAFSADEQKALLSLFLDKAKKASNEASEGQGDSVFQETLIKALKENAFKFDKSFIQSVSMELKNDAGLINSVNQALKESDKLVRFQNPNAVSDIEIQLVQNSKKWDEIKQKLSPQEIKTIQSEIDNRIKTLNVLIQNNSDYSPKSETGQENITAYIKGFTETTSNDPNDKKIAEAKKTYFNLVMNKAAEARETREGMDSILNGSGLGNLFGQGIAAIVLFTAFKALTGGNSHMTSAFGTQAQGGGGFMKKALGLVFMATVMNNTGLLTGANAQKPANNIVNFTSKQEQEKPANNIVGIVREAAGNLLGV
ncbi:MAG: hypothetical protein VKK32_01630 [Candidatus Melainabacteria bacterium]|nr:hypothetical protein [Candidatus Melainabacteria bacterium]